MKKITMKDIKKFGIPAVVGIKIVLAVFFWTTVARAADPKESVYDRVMKTSTIRCGYFVWPPFLAVDPNTGAKSGVFFDMMEEMGKKLDMKIEWTQELNFGTYIQDLEAGKYDMECTGGWPTAARGKIASYTRPLFYIPFHAFVRADDARFDGNVAAINAPDVKVAAIDGENSQLIRRQRFPLSTEVGLPQNASPTEMMMNVMTGKADAAFTDMVFARQFMDKHMGKLKSLDPRHPLKVIPQNTTVRPGETRFREMIDTAFGDMLLDGTVESVLKKYESGGPVFLRAANPYEVPR